MAWNSRPIAVFVASKTNGVTYSDWFSASAEVMYPKWICFLFNEPEKETNLRQVWNIQYSHNFSLKKIYIRLSLPELVIFVIRAFQMRNTKLYIYIKLPSYDREHKRRRLLPPNQLSSHFLSPAGVHSRSPLHSTSLHSTRLSAAPFFRIEINTCVPTIRSFVTRFCQQRRNATAITLHSHC